MVVKLGPNSPAVISLMVWKGLPWVTDEPLIRSDGQPWASPPVIRFPNGVEWAATVNGREAVIGASPAQTSALQSDRGPVQIIDSTGRVWATGSYYRETPNWAGGSALTPTMAGLRLLSQGAVSTPSGTVSPGLTTEDVQDIIGQMVSQAGGTYNDAAGTITLPSGSGGGGVTVDASLTDATPFMRGGLKSWADAAGVRAAIGAGTSSLALGTTASTAKAGNWTPAIADVGGLQAALDGKAATGHTHTLAQVAQSGATTGQTPQWDGFAWVPATVTAGGSVVDASTTGKGVVQLAGDLGGTATAPTVRQATETAAGKVELATVAEATAGTDTARAVTPAGLKAVAGLAHRGSHAAGGSDALTPADIGAAPAAHTQAAATISDLTETVQDIVGAFIRAGANTTVAYDDAANTFTISSTGTGGGGGTDPEVVRDVIGAAMVAGTGIQVAYDDAADTLTVSCTAVLPTRKINTGAGLTGGGDLAADRTLAVQFGTSAGQVAAGNHTHTAAAVTDSTAVGRSVLTAADALSARTAIGATNLVIGSSGTTAAAGNHGGLVGRYSRVYPRTAAYVLGLVDEGGLVACDSATGFGITLPTDASVAFPVGAVVDVIQVGVGQITIAPAAGVTVNGVGLKLRTRWSALSLIKSAANTWYVIGDVVA